MDTDDAARQTGSRTEPPVPRPIIVRVPAAPVYVVAAVPAEPPVVELPAQSPPLLIDPNGPRLGEPPAASAEQARATAPTPVAPTAPTQVEPTAPIEAEATATAPRGARAPSYAYASPEQQPVSGLYLAHVEQRASLRRARRPGAEKAVQIPHRLVADYRPNTAFQRRLHPRARNRSPRPHLRLRAARDTEPARQMHD